MSNPDQIKAESSNMELSKDGPPKAPKEAPKNTPKNTHCLDALYEVIQSRKDESGDTSYTAQLLAGAPEKPARKLCEEATEILIEALSGDSAAIARESADLLYHLLVLWASAGVKPETVWAEIERRKGLSGLVEKRAREIS